MTSQDVLQTETHVQMRSSQFHSPVGRMQTSVSHNPSAKTAQNEATELLFHFPDTAAYNSKWKKKKSLKEKKAPRTNQKQKRKNWQMPISFYGSETTLSFYSLILF